MLHPYINGRTESITLHAILLNFDWECEECLPEMCKSYKSLGNQELIRHIVLSLPDAKIHQLAHYILRSMHSAVSYIPTFSTLPQSLWSFHIGFLSSPPHPIPSHACTYTCIHAYVYIQATRFFLKNLTKLLPI